MRGMRSDMSWVEEKQHSNKQKKSLLKAGEKTGIMLATALFLFSVAKWDVPLGFFVMSFILFYVHVWLDRAQLKQFHFISNILKGLSLTMFVGSFVMIFF